MVKKYKREVIGRTQTLSNSVEPCQTLSNPVELCRTLSNYFWGGSSTWFDPVRQGLTEFCFRKIAIYSSIFGLFSKLKRQNEGLSLSYFMY